MEKLYLFVLLKVIIAFSLTSSDKVNNFTVTKRLENGDILPVKLWSEFSISCPSSGPLLLTAKVPITNSVVSVYLANEDKNILELTLSGSILTGHKYETPYGKVKRFKTPYVNIEGIITARIPREWIPKEVTRISASVQVQDDLYNYYGIFNRPISIPDTMVVEEFKKITLC